MKSVILTAIVVLGVSIVPAGGQQVPHPPEQAGEAIKLSTELVIVDAHVVSKRTGDPVKGLRKEDFAVYEDGVKQEITHFSRDLLPLSLVLLMEGSYWSEKPSSPIRGAGQELLKRLKLEDEIAIMFSGLHRILVEKFTT